MLKLADLAVREDFSLGSLRVSPALRLIRGPAGEVHVEPLTMQVLLALADANGQVVTRDYLYDECWGGAHVGDYSLNRAITMVRRIAAEAGPGAFTIESIPRTGYRLVVDDGVSEDADRRATSKWRTPAVAGVIAITALAIGGSAWILLDRGSEEPTIAIVADTDPNSAELAGSITSGAMTAAAIEETPLRLLDEFGAQRARPDFILRVRDAHGRAGRKVDLTLVSQRDGTLLWTWTRSEPIARAAALDQLAREAGASVVACAAETRAGGASPDVDTVQLYIDACSKFDARAGADLASLVDAFQKVTTRAPQLRGAWSKLFLSKSEAIEATPPADLMDSLKQDMRNAQAHHIDIPELYAAKATTLPPNARFERLRLCEEMLARHPSSAFLLASRSWLLRAVGRMDEAARTARKLATLYPQSAAANTEYVNSLMNSGRAQAARNVLDRATRLAPDATNLKWARWRLEMRYGDPKAALAMANSGEGVVDPPMISFLRARIDPTEANFDRAIREFSAAYRQSGDPGLLVQALGSFGRTDEAIQVLLQFDASRAGDKAEDLFRPHMRQIRHDPRFVQIARNFGLTDYWIRSGILPDFCYDPDLPYDCKREFGKMTGTLQ